MATTKGKTTTKKEEIKDTQQPQIDMEALISQITKTVTAEVEKKYEEKLKEVSTINTEENGSEISLKPTDKVKVKNVVYGGLGYKTSTGATKIWDEHGHSLYMTVQEILELETASPEFIQEPLVMILNDELAEHLGMTDTYKRIREVEDLDKLFKNDITYIEDTISLLPDGYKRELANEVMILNELDEIDSGKLKRMLQRCLHVDLGIKSL